MKIQNWRTFGEHKWIWWTESAWTNTRDIFKEFQLTLFYHSWRYWLPWAKTLGAGTVFVQGHKVPFWQVTWRPSHCKSTWFGWTTWHLDAWFRFLTTHNTWKNVVCWPAISGVSAPSTSGAAGVSGTCGVCGAASGCIFLGRPRFRLTWRFVGCFRQCKHRRTPVVPLNQVEVVLHQDLLANGSQSIRCRM